MPVRANGMKAVLRGIALTVLWLLIVAACLEVGLRLLPQAVPLAFLSRFDPGIRSEIAARRDLTRSADTVLLPRNDGGPPARMWFYKPGFMVKNHDDEEGVVAQVQMDQNGLCNSPADLYQAPRFDVIALGDSFTWCTAVKAEETWPARFQAMSGLSTYNTGMSGRGLYEYLQILEHFGLPKRPDIVVMAVYEGNDFRDAHRFHRARAGDKEGGEQFVCVFSWKPLCRIHEHLDATFLRRMSYAYNLLSGAVHALSYSATKGEIDFRYEVRFSDGATLEFNSENGDRDEVQYARWLVEGQLGTGLFDEALRTLMELSAQYDFLPVVVYVPSAYTAYEEQSSFEDPAVEAALRSYSRTLREYFAGQAGGLGYAYVDTTPAIQRESRALSSADRLYFRSNVHLTQQGHEVVARAVADALSQQGDGRASSRAP